MEGPGVGCKRVSFLFLLLSLRVLLIDTWYSLYAINTTVESQSAIRRIETLEQRLEPHLSCFLFCFSFVHVLVMLGLLILIYITIGILLVLPYYCALNIYLAFVFLVQYQDFCFVVVFLRPGYFMLVLVRSLCCVFFYEVAFVLLILVRYTVSSSVCFIFYSCIHTYTSYTYFVSFRSVFFCLHTRACMRDGARRWSVRTWTAPPSPRQRRAARPSSRSTRYTW